MNREIIFCGGVLIVLMVSTSLQATMPQPKTINNDTFLTQPSDDSAKPINSALDVNLLAKRTIRFYPNRSDFRTNYYKILDVHARYLKTHPSARVQLIRYAPLDQKHTNYSDLGRLRANSVRRYLLNHGAIPQQISEKVHRDSRALQGISQDDLQPIGLDYVTLAPTQ